MKHNEAEKKQQQQKQKQKQNMRKLIKRQACFTSFVSFGGHPLPNAELSRYLSSPIYSCFILFNSIASVIEII